MDLLKRKTLYFPIYKRIEEEVKELSFSVCFCDNQLSVFSLNIANLIIRCEVEIESVAKDIYRMQNDSEPAKTSDCFNWMEKNWEISKKELIIDAPNFYFDEMKCIKPFNYKKETEDDYYSAYNAIKHDRAKNISQKATINVLIRALGALYILNNYIMNETFQLGDDIHASRLDRRFGSDIFMSKIAPCRDSVIFSSEEDIIPENCIYRIVRKDSLFAFSILFKNTFGDTQNTSLVMTNQSFQDFAKNYDGQLIDSKSFWDKISKITKMSVNHLKFHFMTSHKAKNILNIKAFKMKPSFYVELNF